MAQAGASVRQEQITSLLGDLRESTPPAVPLEIVPHRGAPLFSDPSLAPDRLRRAIGLFLAGGAVESEDDRQLLAQAGLVNLWVFAKFIAGFSGPFNLLTDHLHADMCNYRQRLLAPGTRGAMFIPRLHFKTSVVTEAASAWEIARWPNIRIRITNAKDEYATGFMHSIKDIFDDNPLVEYLYPHLYVGKSSTQSRWNESEIVCPARTRSFREATVEAGGVGGASEGHHFDLHVVDDLIGLKALNSMQISAAEMHRARNWFWPSEKSLLVSMRDSRVIVVGTRYAEDDVYSDILDRACEMEGWKLPSWEPSLTGRWRVYYRMVAEAGQIIFPENVTAEDLREMAENDWWALVTQFFNWPQASGLAELSDWEPKTCELVRGDDGWEVVLWVAGAEERLPLAVCDVIQVEDPAATERYISAKHSRTAWGAMAMDESERVFLLDLRADYVPPDAAIEWLFLGKRKWPVRASYLEMQGAFKMLGPMVRAEESRRGRWINLRAVKSTGGGDKDARIRTSLQPLLSEGRLYVEKSIGDPVREELRSFPQSIRKDILDMLSMGVGALVKPLSAEEERQSAEAGKRWSRRAALNAAGY